MRKKYKRRKNLAPTLPSFKKKREVMRAETPLRGEARFAGKGKELKCEFDLNEIPKGFLLVGELEELECETPSESKIDSIGLVKSRKKALVVASGDGKIVMIVSADKVKGDVWIDPEHEDVKEAVEMHTAFHGTEHDSIKKVETDDTDWLVFWGHLNHIVYSVPQYSERQGVPFIHEAKDRGDGVPPAKEKPIVCLSPKRDFLVMYGVQFEFTERGIIG